MKKLLVSLLVFITGFLIVPTVYAADLSITCDGSTVCVKSGTEPLFSTATDGLWYPNRTVTKVVNLKNASQTQQVMAVAGMEISDESETNPLANVLRLTIVPTAGGPVYFQNTLSNFYAQDRVELGSFNPETATDYNFTIVMDKNAGNQYQNQETVFDLTLGFWSTNEQEPTPTPTPTSTTSTTGGGGGGGGGGGSTNAPSCNDAKPGSAPTLLSAAPGLNSVTLTWNKAADPVNYYLVAYGLSSGSLQFGNPNIGDKNTISFTVSGLSGGITYYFRIRAGNGCTPGDFSNELSATPFGSAIGGPAIGFGENVLGASTSATIEENTPNEPVTPSALGVQKQQVKEVNGASTCAFCVWWQILLGETVVLFLYYIVIVKPLKNRKQPLARFAIPIAAEVVFLFINRACFISGFVWWKFWTWHAPFATWQCKYFWLLNIGVYLLFALYWKSKQRIK